MMFCAAQRHDHQERAQVHERVDQHVDRDALDAGVVAGDQAEQHVAGVRDRAVGQQALDVGLVDGGQVADVSVSDRDHGEQRLPGLARGGQRAEEDAQQEGDRRGLRGHRKIRGHRGRRAFVGVGRPHVERRGGDLEEQADGRGRQPGRPPGPRPAAAAMAPVMSASLVEPAMPYITREAVRQEAARERAEQQILHGGFVGALLAAQEADHDVEAQRHQLQADEEGDQVGAGRQEVHAALREQDQAVVLAVMLAGDLQVLVGDDRDDERGNQEDPVEEDGEAVDRDRSR